LSTQYLSHQGAVDVAGDADPQSVHVGAEDGAGTVRSVPISVAIALAGEVLFDDLYCGEGRVRSVDPGVQHGNGDTAAVERAGLGPNGAYAPGRSLAGRVGFRLFGLDEQQRHDRRHPLDRLFLLELIQLLGCRLYPLHRQLSPGRGRVGRLEPAAKDRCVVDLVLDDGVIQLDHRLPGSPGHLR